MNHSLLLLLLLSEVGMRQFLHIDWLSIRPLVKDVKLSTVLFSFVRTNGSISICVCVIMSRKANDVFKTANKLSNVFMRFTISLSVFLVFKSCIRVVLGCDNYPFSAKVDSTSFNLYVKTSYVQ